MKDQRICDNSIQTEHISEAKETDQNQQIAEWLETYGEHDDHLTIRNGSGQTWLITHHEANADVQVYGDNDHVAECPSMHAALHHIADQEGLDPAELISGILCGDDVARIDAVARLHLEHDLIAHSDLLSRHIRAVCGHTYVLAVPRVMLDVGLDVLDIDDQMCPVCEAADADR